MNLLYTNARIGGFFQSGFGVSFNSSPEDNTLPYPLSLSLSVSRSPFFVVRPLVAQTMA